MQKTLTERTAELEARRKVLTSRMDTIETELDSHQSQDWEDLATEREADEVLQGMGSSAQTELRMIGAALQRIAEGSYGQCGRCGNEISEERLDVLPFTPLCRDCAVALG